MKQHEGLKIDDVPSLGVPWMAVEHLRLDPDVIRAQAIAKRLDAMQADIDSIKSGWLLEPMQNQLLGIRSEVESLNERFSYFPDRLDSIQSQLDGLRVIEAEYQRLTRAMAEIESLTPGVVLTKAIADIELLKSRVETLENRTWWSMLKDSAISTWRWLWS